MSYNCFPATSCNLATFWTGCKARVAGRFNNLATCFSKILSIRERSWWSRGRFSWSFLSSKVWRLYNMFVSLSQQTEKMGERMNSAMNHRRGGRLWKMISRTLDHKNWRIWQSFVTHPYLYLEAFIATNQSSVLRIFEKYLEIPKKQTIFVPQNNKDENNFQKYLGWILYQKSSI